MIRKFKTLGLALAAVFAMSALGASAASAAEFHAASAPAALTGNQSASHVFTTTSGTVTCKTATFEGTQNVTTSTTVTMTPNYDNCTAFGFIGVPIHENGCGYIFHANGTTEVECPAGKQFEITVPGCTTTVGPQHLAAGGNEFTTTTTFVSGVHKTHISVHTKISGITYQECGGALQHGGTYHGPTTVTSSVNLSHT